MAVSPIDKIKIIALNEHKEEILELLYGGGFLEIIKESGPEAGACPAKDRKTSFIRLEFELAQVRHALDALQPFYRENQGFWAKLNYEKKALRQKDIDDLLQSFNYRITAELIAAFGRDSNHLKSLIAKLREDIKYLDPWRGLRYATGHTKTQRTMAFYGSMDLQAYLSLRGQDEQVLKYMSWRKVSQNEQKCYLAGMVLKEEYSRLMAFLEEHSFQSIELPEFDITVSQKIERLENEIRTTSARLANLQKRLEGEYRNYYGRLQIIADHLQWELDQASVQDHFCFTKRTFCLTGWLPKSRSEKLRQSLAAISPHIVLQAVPAADGEEPPVLMANSGLIQPFEFVTNIYGHPRHNEVDPTPFLAGFFIIFFGLCLTDAGYGITLGIISFLALKFLKVSREFRKLLKVLLIGSFVTIVAGGLTGGWFGIALSDLPAGLKWLVDPLMRIRVIDPVSNPIAILILSLILGYVHLVFGNSIKLWWRIKNGELKVGLVESGVWLYFLLSAGLWLAAANFAGPGLAAMAKYLFYAAIPLVVFTRGQGKNIALKVLTGLGDLYFGITGYISDILSYSRLLALGLATGIIGMVINVIGLMAGELVPYVGWLLMIMIIVGGHIFNLTISLIGAFIHSGRLQYVEFFKTFFEGGGRQFSPFVRHSQYIHLINEQIDRKGL